LLWFISSYSLCFFVVALRRPPIPPLFPYTTLFRSPALRPTPPALRPPLGWRSRCRRSGAGLPGDGGEESFEIPGLQGVTPDHEVGTRVDRELREHQPVPGEHVLEDHQSHRTERVGAGRCLRGARLFDPQPLRVRRRDAGVEE